MKVLVIGKGGREHALCWKLKQSRRVTTVFCAPGNAGTHVDAQNVAIEVGDTRALIQFAKREGVGLTIVGPEEPLTLGIVDAFQKEGLRIFGPSRLAAELEGSKVFAKELMRQAGIPTADYRLFRSAPDAEHYVLSREVSLVVRSKGRSTIRNTLLCRTAQETLEAIDRIMDPREMLGPGVQVEIEEKGQRRAFSTAGEAKDHVLGRPLGMVLKADGLAAGKGVFVCDNLRQALDAIDQVMVRRVFGKAGDRLILEERLDGQETSILAFTDGRTIVPLVSSQDHKRAFDHDEGPNTGGMGAYSPAEVVTPELMDQVEREILVPVVHALKRARRPFRGVLYAGLMLTNQGPKVLEFNVRFGDPECQAILMRLKSDLLDALEAVVDEKARPGRAGLGPPAGGDGGDGLGGVSGSLRTRAGDQQSGGGRPDGGREGLPRRHGIPDRPHPGPGRPGDHRRRPGPGCHGARGYAGQGPGQGLRGGPGPSGSTAAGIAAISPTEPSSRASRSRVDPFFGGHDLGAGSLGGSVGFFSSAARPSLAWVTRSATSL